MAGKAVLTKVLVVDDDWGAPLFKVAGKQLAGVGFDLVGTSSFDVDEVLSQVENVRPQVVLLDILNIRVGLH